MPERRITRIIRIRPLDGADEALVLMATGSIASELMTTDHAPLAYETEFLIADDEIRNRDLRIGDVVSFEPDRIAETVRVSLRQRSGHARPYCRG